MGHIHFHSADTPFVLRGKRQIRTWLLDIIRQSGHSAGEISIVFCSDEYLLGINRQFLDHDYYTDIVTFQLSDDPIEGELYISLDRVRENAYQFSQKYSVELCRVMAHGILHLIGYKDKTNSQINKMREMEQRCLEQLMKQTAAKKGQTKK